MDTNKNSIVPNATPTSAQQFGDHNLSITNADGGIVNIVQNPPTDHDENGVPYTPVNHVRFDNQSNIIYLGNEQVKIPIELVQPGLLQSEELPYIHALCDAYAKYLTLRSKLDSVCYFSYILFIHNLLRSTESLHMIL